ncbi:hypothetical protein [Baia soyae]|uniref:Uncharacterized protein n=1 Tax=Baia soyae TaxID=1544746 RepID=A0A4R2RJF2_9BACL|nr:hypothetical protein [Baia soyae]TCP62639.1 hypothetical protein EDD57_1526 [Baia soyae]
MSKPIRCIECYKQRPGGRCDFCPLHKKNRDHYIPLENGWFLPKKEQEPKSQPKEEGI